MHAGWWILAAVAAWQDPLEVELQRGLDWLRSIGEDWARALPEERLLARYVGKRFVGAVRIRVSRVPAGKRGAFEVQVIDTWEDGPVPRASSEWIVLDRDLIVVSVRTARLRERGSGNRLEVAEGKWRLEYDDGSGAIGNDSGELRPAMMWGHLTLYLPLYREPSAAVALWRFTSERMTDRIRPHRAPRSPDGERNSGLSCTGSVSPRWVLDWFFREGGALAEGRWDGMLPVRLLPVRTSELGQDLTSPVRLTEPERAVVSMCRAVAIGDSAAIEELIDARSIAEEWVADFDALEPDERNLVLEQVREGAGSMFAALRHKFASVPPDRLEEVVALLGETGIDGASASVRLRGFVFRLRQAPTAGWRFVGLEPDEESRERLVDRYEAGRRALAAMAESWRGLELPHRRSLGIYLSRLWIGEMKVSIDRAPADSGAEFALTVEYEYSFQDVRLKRRSLSLLDGSLRLVRCNIAEESPRGIEREEMRSVPDGWRRRSAAGSVPFERKGREGLPALTVEEVVLLMPLFALPDTSLAPACYSPREGRIGLRRSSLRTPVTVEGEVRNVKTFEIDHDFASFAWHLSDEGAPLQFVPAGAPIRFRPVDGDRVGRSLEEPLSLNGPQEAVVELLSRVRNQDHGGALRCFDIPATLARSPNWDALSDEAKRARRERWEEAFPPFLQRAFAPVPPREILEDAVAALLQIEWVGEDRATARWHGMLMRLERRPQEGDASPRWMFVECHPDF
jgi:hypothetical protein